MFKLRSSTNRYLIASPSCSGYGNFGWVSNINPEHKYSLSITQVPKAEDFSSLFSALVLLNSKGVPSGNIQILIPWYPYNNVRRNKPDEFTKSLSFFDGKFGELVTYTPVLREQLEKFWKDSFNQSTLCMLNELQLTQEFPKMDYIGMLGERSKVWGKSLKNKNPKIHSKVRHFTVRVDDPDGLAVPFLYISTGFAGRVALLTDFVSDGEIEYQTGKLIRTKGSTIESLTLFTVHGTFIHGVEELKSMYNSVYCLNPLTDNTSVLNDINTSFSVKSKVVLTPEEKFLYNDDLEVKRRLTHNVE